MPSLNGSRTANRARMLALSVVVAAISMMTVAATANAYTVYEPDTCKLTLATSGEQTINNNYTLTATLTVPPPIATEVPEVDVVEQETNFCSLGESSQMVSVDTEGIEIEFTVTSGPNAGKTERATLVKASDTTLTANFTWTSPTVGLDSVVADLICNQLQLGTAASTSSISCGRFVIIESAQTALAEGEQSLLTSNVATVNWVAPVQEVKAQVQPTVSMSLARRCTKSSLAVNPTITAASAGGVKSATLYVDGKKYKTLTTGPFKFKVNTKKLKAGKHLAEVVTTFTDSRQASTRSEFKRCAVKVTARRIAPRFTG